MIDQSAQNIRFGPFILETASRCLLREGRRVRISPIELKLLETLLIHRDRVLTGDDLRVLVWADDPSIGFVPAQDVNSLYVAIRKLRRSLGDHGKWIVNIPKVGYAISDDAEVEADNAESGELAASDHLFVGREAELKKLKKLVSSSCLITLTGPPGVGKSRLAFELAAETADQFPDGTYIVNLVPIENESLVNGAVLGALELIERAESTEIETICDHLSEKKALIILDNCEHLIDACSSLVEHLIRTLPNLRVVATSFEPLMLPGERVVPVRPLSLPNSIGKDGGNAGATGTAVELFIKIVKQHRSDIEIEKEDPERIGDLCRQLEGLPLAIELAAVQVGAYTVDQIIEAMADRFRLLRRRGGQNARHKALEDAVDWSFSLLTEEGRILLQRLSVFNGGFSVESAQGVCSGSGIDEGEVVHLLAQLVRRSLIQLDPSHGSERYSMLETIRQFARRCLRQSGEEETMLDRRDRFLLELAERSFEAGGDASAIEKLKTEYNNIRSALDRSLSGSRDIETALRLCGAIPRFWYNYGRFNEAKFWTKRALEADGGNKSEARARALRSAGFFYGQFSGAGEDPEVGRSYFEESLAFWREIGAKSEEAFTLVHYAFLLYRLGRPNEAEAAARKSFDISSSSGDQANIARSANNLALALLDLGEGTQARSFFEIALSAARLADDQFLIALCGFYLAEIAFRMGELEDIPQILDQCLDLFNLSGNRPHAARTILLLGETASLQDRHKEALEFERSALREFSDIDDQQGIASALEAIACTRSMSGSEPGLFLTLSSAAAKIRHNSKQAAKTRREETLERLSKKAKTSLGKTAAAAAIERGTAMSVEDAIEMAMLD